MKKLSDPEEDAFQSIIAQISQIWVQIPITEFNWKVFVSEFNFPSNWVGGLQSYQNYNEQRKLSQHIVWVLEYLHQKDPTLTIQMVHTLAKQIANYHISDEHYRLEYLKERFGAIFRLAEIPLGEDRTIPLDAIVGSPFRFLDETGMSDFFLLLIQEINVAFNTGCYTSAGFLSRKLLESLLLSTLKRRYQNTNPSVYTIMSRGWTKGFKELIDEFRTRFDTDFKSLSAIQNQTDIDRLLKNLDGFRVEFNVVVHELGSFKTRDNLLDSRADLQYLVCFLWNLMSNII